LTYSAEKMGILLAPGDELGWAEIRTALAVLDQCICLGEVKHPDHLRRALSVGLPQGLITSRRLGERHYLELVNALVRSSAPLESIVVLGNSFDDTDILPSVNGANASFLLWEDLTTGTLEECLRVALFGRAVVVSPDVMIEVIRIERTRACPLLEKVTFNAREAAVLRRLAMDESRTSVAEAEGLSMRVLERTLADLRRKLNVRSEFALAVRAAQSGVLVDAVAA
jgi:DNA-binding NarL/FixJ family response regulator